MTQLTVKSFVIFEFHQKHEIDLASTNSSMRSVEIVYTAFSFSFLPMQIYTQFLSENFHNMNSVFYQIRCRKKLLKKVICCVYEK